MRTIWAFLLLASVASAQEIVNVEGRNVRIRVEGTGSPAVIFESGFGGDGVNSWTPIFPEIARMTRAFAYDRAGIGKSDAIATPRTYNAIVSELHAILQNQKIAPPYILVGHSYGGALVRAFYALYPSEVSGIVFVDPMTETVFQNNAKESVAQQEATMGSAPAGIRAEWDFLKGEALNNSPILRAVRKPDVPMALLVARINRPDGWAKAVVQQYGPWIRDREDSSMIVTANSSHYIQRDQPELVIGAIRSMLFPNPLGALERTLHEKGADAAVALFRQQQLRYPKGEITPRLLNTLGYMQMRDKHIDDALRFFSLNVEAFPDDANVYDSLAEAYAAKGDLSAALANYRKALKMDPTNTNAAAWIVKLEKEPR
jgi:pimeloyl-ACP methyl ester carboxylesterase